MAPDKCIRRIKIDFFRKIKNINLPSGGNSSPIVKALVQESPVFLLFPCIKQPQRRDPRLVQIHAGILLGSDALESGIHEHMPAGAGWEPSNRAVVR